MQRFLTSVIVAGLIGLGTGSAYSQDEVIRIDTDMVVLPVRVVDKHGHLVRDLNRNQFHVFEDGVEQEIAHFERPDNANLPDAGTAMPLTIALMLDVSDSTQFKLEQIQKVASSFVEVLTPADRVMLVAFDKGVNILLQPTADHTGLQAVIRNLRSGGGTSLYQALELVTKQLNRLSGRKAIVLLTDGVDTSSAGATAQSTLSVAEHSYVTVFPVQYDTYLDFSDNTSREIYAVGEFGKVAHLTKNGEPASEAYKRATIYLRLLAQKTGGHFQFADRTTALARSFARIAEQLRQQYTVGYYPKNKALGQKPRQIKVMVAVPAAKVETRTSYVYKPVVNQ